MTEPDLSFEEHLRSVVLGEDSLIEILEPVRNLQRPNPLRLRP